MFYRFTDRARTTINTANKAAKAEGATHISACHVLIGILDEGSGMGFHALLRLGVKPADLRSVLVRTVQSRMITLGKLPLMPEARTLIDNSIAISRELGTNYVGTEHLTLALIRDAEVGPILAKVGVSEAKATEVVRAMLVEAGVYKSPTFYGPDRPGLRTRVRSALSRFIARL